MPIKLSFKLEIYSMKNFVHYVNMFVNIIIVVKIFMLDVSVFFYPKSLFQSYCEKRNKSFLK